MNQEEVFSFLTGMNEEAVRIAAAIDEEADFAEADAMTDIAVLTCGDAE